MRINYSDNVDTVIAAAMELFGDDDADPAEFESLIRKSLQDAWEDGFQSGLDGMR